MEQCMRANPQLLSDRLKAFVRSKADAKTLARMIGCDVRTAENIRRGHWPVARHWAGLVATFGRDLTDAVFHPSAAAARLEAEVRELEQQLAERRAALGIVAGASPGRSQVLAALENRASGSVRRRRSTDHQPNHHQP
jgi:hypothetical protein